VSTNPIELGTIEFPFKAMIYVFAELMNEYVDETYTVTVYLKANTVTTLYTLFAPVVFINGNLSIM
jgi:hypothetical protein